LNSGEIVYITFSHYQGFGDSPEKEQRMADFLNLVKDRLGDRAYKVETKKDQVINNPFEQTYNQIINSPTEAHQRDSGKKGHPSNSVVILVTDSYSADSYKDLPEENTQDKFFWPLQYCPPKLKDGTPNQALHGFYTNTSDKNGAINGQITNQTKARELDLPFPLYMTLTPQDEECAMIVTYGASEAIAEFGAALIASINPVSVAVGMALVALAMALELTESMLPYKSLKELSGDINKDLYVNVNKTFANQSPNDISIIYVDFYEKTTNVDLVDTAIALSYQ
jgi:hypothetical protein